jgi:flagellar hook-basal body complex protein FliE
LLNAVDSLQNTQAAATSQQAQAAAGQGNIAEAMITTAKASLATQVTVALLNKAVTAFTEVMNLPI